MAVKYSLPFPRAYVKRRGNEIQLLHEPGDSYDGFMIKSPYEEGLEVISVGRGVVVVARQLPLDCLKFLGHKVAHSSNKVVVRHEGDVLVEYVHLHTCVRKGQEVEEGQPLGKLGGFLNYPHIHLAFGRITEEGLQRCDADLVF